MAKFTFQNPFKKAARPVESPPDRKANSDLPTELLLVWAVPTKNQKIVIAYRPNTNPNDPNNLVTVNVRANWNFMLNMRMRCSRVSDTVYDLVGPLPRWKGRW